MPVEQQDVCDIQALISAALKIARTKPHGAFLWFRGISSSQYELVPKIMRDGKDINQVFERETRLLTRFRQRSMAYWPSGYPQNEWEHLFAMQHFGMPTRLLDWSENLFIAAYFALSDQSPHSHDGQCTPVIWCVDPVEWNRSTPVLSEYGTSIQVLTTADEELEPYQPTTKRKRNKSPIAIFGAHNSARIVAQRGTFFVWGNEIRSLESVAEDMSATLWKLNITGAREELIRDLQSIGFGETMVFPELSFLATELSRTEGWKV